MSNLRKPKLAPPSWLNDAANKLSVAYAFIVCLSIGFMVMVWLLIAKIDEKSEFVVIALDGTRTAHIGPGQAVDEKNNPLWTTLAHNCADAAFSMDANGNRRPDLLTSFFSEAAKGQIKGIHAEWREQLLERDARMTPVIRTIHTIRQLDGVVHVLVGGTLEIIYTVAGRIQVDDRDFLMVVALEKNSNYAEVGSLPFVCSRINKIAYGDSAKRVLDGIK